MLEKHELEYAKNRIEKLKDNKKDLVLPLIIYIFGLVSFTALTVWSYLVSKNTVAFVTSLFAVVFATLIFHISCQMADISRERKRLLNEVKKHFKEKLETTMQELKKELNKLVKVINVPSRQNEVCLNLKFRDEIIANNCGKLTNKTLIEDFFNEKIADENFDDGSVVPVTIKMAIDKFKNYDFALQVPYLTMLKRYEDKQELLDKYNKQEQKPKTKRKTNKNK